MHDHYVPSVLWSLSIISTVPVLMTVLPYDTRILLCVIFHSLLISDIVTFAVIHYTRYSCKWWWYDTTSCLQVLMIPDAWWWKYDDLYYLYILIHIFVPHMPFYTDVDTCPLMSWWQFHYWWTFTFDTLFYFCYFHAFDTCILMFCSIWYIPFCWWYVSMWCYYWWCQFILCVTCYAHNSAGLWPRYILLIHCSTEIPVHYHLPIMILFCSSSAFHLHYTFFLTIDDAYWCRCIYDDVFCYYFMHYAPHTNMWCCNYIPAMPMTIVLMILLPFDTAMMLLMMMMMWYDDEWWYLLWR